MRYVFIPISVKSATLKSALASTPPMLHVLTPHGVPETLSVLLAAGVAVGLPPGVGVGPPGVAVGGLPATVPVAVEALMFNRSRIMTRQKLINELNFREVFMVILLGQACR